MSSEFSWTEIKNARKRKGITLVELADKMGMSQRDMVRLERGEVVATSEQIKLIKSIIDDWPEDEERFDHQSRHPL